MQRITILLKVILLVVIFMLIINPHASADPNMDGGGSGGGTQEGTDQNFYSSGDDGVRITVIDITTKRRAEDTKTIDYSKKDKNGKGTKHFGKNNKLDYMGVAGYSSPKVLAWSSDIYMNNTYTVTELPIIISSSKGNSNIDTIKRYFNDSARLQLIATRVGMSYEAMICGNYKILIEPLIYLTFEGNYIAMTAHEAALLDMMLGGTKTTGGALRAKFVSFSHKNLPLSIFLEKKDLGVKPWTGSKYNRVLNGSMLEYLGIGILSFKGGEVGDTGDDTDISVEGGSYTYRPDTDVITSVEVSVGEGGWGATSDNPVSVQFSGAMIPTTTITGIVIPAGGSRLVWFKWHTPAVTSNTSTTINVNIVGGSGSPSSASITAKINPIKEYEPPNTSADDKKPFGWVDSFLPTLPSFPKLGELKSYSTPQKSLSWHTYTCTKYYEWTGDYYTDEDGEFLLDADGNKIPIYEAKYYFTTNNYSASITSTNAKITPDTTLSDANPDPNIIKSGYGIEMRATSNISSNSPTDTTGIQNAVTYFPEFSYKNYRRLSKLPGASLNDTIQFPVNLYSQRGNRVHFLPIWFPNTVYKVYIETMDAWTPAGMLCDQTTASINVQGSMWDDWYIQVLPWIN
jgi:hypothetical protein